MREGTIKPRHQDLEWFGYEPLLRPTPRPEYPTGDFTMSISSLQAKKTVYTSLTLFSDTKLNVERREERSLNNNLFHGEYECSSLALDREERREEDIRSLETRSNN
ncbi:hypothetical protein Tco_0753238, partial [Tanacetum coccineum]